MRLLTFPLDFLGDGLQRRAAIAILSRYVLNGVRQTQAMSDN